MAIQTYSTEAGRINEVLGETIAHSIPREVLSVVGMKKEMPRNKGDNITYRSWLPPGAAAATPNVWTVTTAGHATSEGVTPTAETLTPRDVTVTLQQYACLYSYTDKVEDLYEDDIPSEMKKMVGQRMGLVREKVRYGAYKAGTNLFYSGGTSRTTVDEAITLKLLRRVARSIDQARGEMITEVLEASAKYSTSPVEAAYVVFCHTDCSPDIRDLPGFKHVSEYGQRKVMHERELGSCENFRFIVSPELSSVADAGAAVGSTGLYSTTGTDIDVYPVLITAEDAWGDVMLRGERSLKINHLKPGQIDKSDPNGQKGFVGAKFYSAATVLNNGWMAVAEVGAAILT